MRARSIVLAAFASAAAAVLPGVSASCSDAPTPQRCTGIPPGGCPLSHGVACEDPACEAVYACREGNVWQLDHACAPRDASPSDAAVADADGGEAGPAFDASIDAPPGAFGGPGCNPLQTPDCELGVVLLCESGCCDCQDLYVCQSGSWSLWGTCGDGGVQQTK